MQRIWIKKILPLFAAAVIGLGAKTSCAFLFLPPGPLTPTFDPLTDAMMYVDYGAQVDNSDSSGATNLMQAQTTFTKSALASLAGEVNGLMPTKKEKKQKQKAIDGSKKVKKCKIADIEKPSSVKKAFYKLFLAYPAEERDIKNEYRKKAEELYQDTVIETYVASREMEKKLNELEAKFKQLSPMLVTGQGGNGAQDGSDNNGAWKNSYTAYDTMNELLKLTEELTAMRAQLVATEALRKSITPAAYKKGKAKKADALNSRGQMQVASSATRSGGSELVFAQVDFNNYRAADPAKSYNSDNGAASVSAFAQKQREAAAAASRQEAIGIISGGDDDTSATPASETSEEDYEYDPTKDGSVKFTKPEAPKIASPFLGNEEKIDELNKLDAIYSIMNEALQAHNLIQALPSYRENAEKYDKFVRLHDKSVEVLKTSDDCVLQYFGRYYSNPESVWSGGPLYGDVANYDLRSGVSGWVIKTFEVAKAEKGSPAEPEDMTETEIDVPESSGDMSKIEDNKKFLEKKKTKGLSSPSKEDEVAQKNRETAMLVWEIGAEAAKALAKDQYSSSKWGRAYKRFPIWNDQRGFYDQYLDGKYTNIKEYLAPLEFNKVALELAKQLNDILAETPVIRDFNAAELAKLGSVLGEDKTAEDFMEEQKKFDAEFADLRKNRAVAIAKIKVTRDNSLKLLDKEKARLNALIEKASDDLNNFNERINNLKNSRLSAQNSVTDFQTQLDYINEVEEYGRAQEDDEDATEGEEVAKGEVVYEDTPSQAYAKENIKQNKKKSASVEDEAAYYRKLAVAKEAEIAALKEELALLKPKYEAVNNVYTQQENRFEQEYAAGFAVVQKKVDEYKAARMPNKLIDIYISRVGGNAIDIASVIGFISQAEGLVEDTKDYVQVAVSQARRDLSNLGEELYLTASGGVIVNRHAELMNELKNIPLSRLISFSPALKPFKGYPGITGPLTTLYQGVIAGAACSGGRCTRADKKYFVGALPKVQDFAAPKAAPALDMPPLREAFHFDEVDYDNLLKTIEGDVARDNLINFGPEVPSVWKLILTDDVFEERDANIRAIMEGDGAESFFMRGGRYPCRLDRKVIDIDPYEGQYMVDNVAGSKKLPQCQEIELIGNNGVASKFYYTIRDIEADTEGPAAASTQEVISKPSELGTLFRMMDEGNLRVAKKPEEVFNRLKEISDNEDKDYKTNLKDEIYQNARYDTNQIGDFLNFVETEISYRQNMEELKVSLDEGNNVLKKSLGELGYMTTEEFDISKKESYDLTRDTLERLKNKLVTEGFDSMSDVVALENEVVEERLKKIKGIFTALRKDKDELLALSLNSPSDSELDEQIKSEEVNQKVNSEYKKKADQEFEKQFNKFKRPFCAAY